MLSEEERNLLSAAYKHVYAGIRNALRTVSVVEEKERERIKLNRPSIISEMSIELDDGEEILAENLNADANGEDGGEAYRKGYLQSIVNYRQSLEQEAGEVCGEVIRLIDETLLTASVQDVSGQVFFMKM